MKRAILNKLIIVNCTVMLIICSCTKLHDESYTDLVAKDFVPTDQDIGSLIGTAYGQWRSVLWAGVRSLWTAQEETADAIVRARKPYGFYDGGVHQILHYHTWTSEDVCFGNVWNAAYVGIITCNRVLYQIESGQIPLEEGQGKEAMIGEVRILRASYFYVLCDIFGNVPITTKYDVEEGCLPEQNTRIEVYDFIVKEIKESILALNEKYDVTSYARFNNKWAAYALLAKIYLNAEVWSGTTQWDKCIDACNAVINSGLFGLESIQKDCFLEENQNSKEAVWAVPFDLTVRDYFPVNIITLPHQASETFNLLNAGWGGMISIPQFINTFDPEDKRLTEGWFYGPVYSSSGVLQKVATGNLKGEPMIIVNELPGIDSTEEIHSYRIFKYEVPVGSDPRRMNNDMPIFRYADMLMMKAECLMRLGLPGAGGLVTQVRKRSFENQSKYTVTDAQLLENSCYDYGLRDFSLGTTHENHSIQYGRFLDELGWEFCAEGHRRQDMIRFGVFNRVSYLSYKGQPDGSDDYKNIAPIPLTVLNTNPNIKQNPGYPD